MACAGVADEDGGAVAGLEDQRPVVTDLVGIAMAGRLAQALGRLIAQLVAEPCDLARRHPHAARRERRLVSGLGFDQFDFGGDVDAIGASFCGDPHGNAIRNSSNLEHLQQRWLGNLVSQSSRRLPLLADRQV